MLRLRGRSTGASADSLSSVMVAGSYCKITLMRLRAQPFGRPCGLILALLLALAGAPAHADHQLDPGLREVVATAITQAQCFPDRFDSAVWYKLMEPRLRARVRNDTERLDILTTVYCETHRKGVAPLPPGLILAVIDVESRFDRWAVSNAGAV